jgi:general secretion pathway protein K
MIRSRERDNEGFVLVSVLCVVLLFVAVSATMTLRSRLFVIEERNHLEHLRLQAVVDGVARLAALSIARDRFPMPETGRRGACASNGTRVSVAAIDQDMLLDLNGATPEMIEDVLAAIGIEDTPRKTVAAQVVDFRDPDDFTEALYGAEKIEYRRAALTWTPRNDFFTDADEVAQLPVATPDLLARIGPFFTTYNPRAAIDPALIYARLGKDAERVEKLARWEVPSRRQHFAIRVQARLEGRAAATRLAVFAVPTPGRAPVFLKWSRYEAETESGPGAEPAQPVAEVCAWMDQAGAR